MPPRVKIDPEKPAEKTGGLYFSRPKDNLQFIKSGSTLLDLALGGGWARRRIVNIVGDKSTGKCIRNAYVVSDCGFERLDDFGERDDVDYGTTKFKANLALNSDEVVKTSHFWKEQVQSTIQLVTRHGYNLEGTQDHRIMIWNENCSFGMKKLSDLKVGDIAVVSKSPMCNSAPAIKIDFKDRKSKYANKRKDIKIPEFVTEELAELLGFYIADGCTAGRNICFSNTKPWFKKRFINDMKSVFGFHESEIQYKEENGSGSFWLSRTLLFDFFNHLFEGEIKSLTARYKYVPKCILRSSRKIQAAFLRGLIDCDSENCGSGIVYSTASAQLAQQVHLLLLNFGVAANKQSEPGPKQYSDHLYWDIGIWGKYATIYNEVIGYGRGKLTSSIHLKSSFDIIPFLSTKLASDILEARRLMGWSKNGKTKVGTRFPRFQLVAADVNFENINNVIAAFDPIDPAWFDLSLYKQLRDCNYHFDPIVNVVSNDRIVDVYDVHVPKRHLFWANGFVNHNTLLAIEAAANFAIEEPKGIIRYREAEEAFDDDYAAALGFPLDKVDRGEPIDTIEDVFEDLEKVIKGAKGPEIYIVDSLDALSDRAEMERNIDEGSYGTGKAKMLSQLFRRLVRDLGNKDITVFFISQVRDNIGVMIGKKHTRSGGRALDFYSSQTVWLTQLKKLPRTIKNIERVIGVEIQAKVEKNKIALPYRDAIFSILFGHGIDDRKSCLDFIKKIGIEVDKNLSLEQLQRVCFDKWWEIEQSFLADIKPKYGDSR